MPWHGFLVAESQALVVLYNISERFDLDGYCALPRGAIASIDDDFEKRELLQRALRLNKQSPASPGQIDCTSMSSLMESVQSSFGVLVVEQEEVLPGEVQVGTIRLASKDTFVLRWLSVNAEWENDDRPYRYRDVTRLEFGAAYGQTLLAVAQSRENEG